MPLLHILYLIYASFLLDIPSIFLISSWIFLICPPSTFSPLLPFLPSLPHSRANVPSPCIRAKCAFDISPTLTHPASPIHNLNSSSRIFSANPTPSSPAYFPHRQLPYPKKNKQNKKTYRQSPQRDPPNPTTLRPQRQRLKHIRPTPNPPIHMDRNTARRRFHAFRKRVESSRDPVELTAAVVRHDDAGRAVEHREMRVLAC